MWTQPWGYREGFAIPSGLFVLGLGLHFALGAFPDGAWGYPYNLWGGFLLLGLSVAVGVGARRSSIARFLCSHYAAVGGMAVWGLVMLVMGLTRQVSVAQIAAHGLTGWVHRLGWSHILSTRYFLLLYLYVVVTLGGVVVHRLCVLFTPAPPLGRKRTFARQLSFLLNHVGLYLALWAGLVGAHQIEKYQLQATGGAEYPEWRVHKAGETALREMDFALGLKQFTMEEYPPKLMVIDTIGRALPVGHPWHASVERVPLATRWGEWEVAVEQHLPYSAPVVSQDSLHYVAYGSKGAVHSLKVRAHNRQTGQTVSGWVSAGSYLIPHRGLALDANATLVMPEVEAKQYRSEVFLIAQDGSKVEGTIAVNHPLVFKDWYIYQLDYDHEKGRWSDTSVFELVRDPWLPLVYCGLGLMLLGALALFVVPPLSPTLKKE